jgi:hypothetical protein
LAIPHSVEERRGNAWPLMRLTPHRLWLVPIHWRVGCSLKSTQGLWMLVRHPRNRTLIQPPGQTPTRIPCLRPDPRIPESIQDTHQHPFPNHRLLPSISDLAVASETNCYNRVKSFVYT